MEKIFDHPKYPMAMFLAITIVLLLIVFSFASIIDSNKETIEKNNYKKLEKQLWENSKEYQEEIKKTNPSISGFATNQQEPEKQTQVSKLEYPVKSYLLYFVTLIIIIAGIFAISYRILPKRS